MKLENLQQGIAEPGQSLQNFVHLEQRVNDLVPIMRTWWTSMSDVAPDYSPLQPDGFSCPGFYVEPTEDNFVAANPEGALLNAISDEGRIQFVMHPQNVDKTVFPDEQTEVEATPTSSTRTVFINSADYPYLAKLSLPVRHFNYTRAITAENARYSVRLCAELGTLAVESSGSWAYMPESAAIMCGGQGTVYRELQPRPYVGDQRQLLPAFALYSVDDAAPDDPLLLQQITDKHGISDPLNYFMNHIVEPVQDAWVYFAEERGLLLDMHGQNTLFELDILGQIKRLVIRDFDSIYTDAVQRKERDLPLLKDNVFTSDERAKQYAVSYDHMLGLSFLSRIITKFVGAYPDYRPDDINTQIAERFRNIASPTLQRVFPADALRLPSSDAVWTGMKPVSIGKPAFR